MTTQRETFRCTIERGNDDRIIALNIEATGLQGEPRAIRVNGTKAVRVAASLHDVLRHGGIRSRVWAGSKPFDLDNATGAHAELLLLAVRPLRRADKAERIAERIALMSGEEASYWHAKSHYPGGLPALRLLLNAGAK